MKEYFEVLRAVGLGLFVMGGLGYAVRLLHYPVKEVLMGKI